MTGRWVRPDQLTKVSEAAPAASPPQKPPSGASAPVVDAKKAEREAERLQNEKLAREKKMRADQDERDKMRATLEDKMAAKRATQEAIDSAQSELDDAKSALSSAQAHGATLNGKLAGGAGGKRSRRPQLTLPAEGLEPSNVQELARLVAKARVAVEQADDDKQKALKLCVKMLGKGKIVDALEGGAGLRELLDENSGR